MKYLILISITCFYVLCGNAQSDVDALRYSQDFLVEQVDQWDMVMLVCARCRLK